MDFHYISIAGLIAARTAEINALNAAHDSIHVVDCVWVLTREKSLKQDDECMYTKRRDLNLSHSEPGSPDPVC